MSGRCASRAWETYPRARLRSPRQSSLHRVRGPPGPLPPFAGRLFSRIRKCGRAQVKSALRISPPDLGRASSPAARPKRRLFRRVEQRSDPGAQLIEQRSFVRLSGLEVAHFNVAEAADFLRNGGKPHRDVVVLAIEPRQYLLEHRLVFAHEGAFGPALLGIAERIEGGAAEEFEFRQQPEQREDPRPDCHLLRLTGRLVETGEKRRRKMHIKTQV